MKAVHKDFPNQLNNDQPSRSSTETEMVCDNDLFELISISIDDIDFSVAQPEEPEIEEKVILDGDHYQVDGSVIRYCRK